MADRLRVAVRHHSEILSSLLVQSIVLQLRHVLPFFFPRLDLLLLLLQVLVDFDIDLVKVIDWICSQGLLASVFLESKRQQTILLAPVAKIVYFNHIPPGTFVEIGQEATNDCASQVTGVERLRNVGRRELDNNAFLPLCGIVGISQPKLWVLAEMGATLSDHGDDKLGENRSLEEEGQEVTEGFRLFDQVGIRELVLH